VLAALHDPILVLVSFAAVSALVVAARIAGARGVSPVALRKSLHVAVGLWTVFITPFFQHLAWALVPPLGFIELNASGKTRAWAPGLVAAEGAAANRGLWTFPLGVAVAYILFWDDPGRAAILAGVGTLALADPAAAMVGRRWGQRRLHPLGHGRTLEGSIAFFIVAAIVVGYVAAFQGETVLPLRLSVACGAAGALAEMLAPPGWDNLAVPVVVGAAYQWFA
jgi:phytol kinase